MITHTTSDLNCTSTNTSIESLDILCQEISRYLDIGERVGLVLEVLNETNINAQKKIEFARNFTGEHPKLVRDVICAPYSC